MKPATITKTIDKQHITKEQLEKIGRYTRRDIPAETLYVFSLLLCDNEVDREYERFSDQALQTLASLYLGKTGVFDHNPKAAHQAARIFDTQVVTEESLNSQGRPYRYLKAWAYMIRCEKNKDLILEIDGGIKKEVSVGCAVAKVSCSICEGDMSKGTCQHTKGKKYKGVPCHHVLEEPTDAYEWSFVAVPAQRNAGITKGHRIGRAVVSPQGMVEKMISATEPLTLSLQEQAALGEYIDSLKEFAQLGAQRRKQLEQEIVRYGATAQPELDSSALESVAKKMTLAELEQFHKGFLKAAGQHLPLVSQLGQPVGQRMEQSKEKTDDTLFKI